MRCPVSRPGGSPAGGELGLHGRDGPRRVQARGRAGAGGQVGGEGVAGASGGREQPGEAGDVQAQQDPRLEQGALAPSRLRQAHRLAPAGRHLVGGAAAEAGEAAGPSRPGSARASAGPSTATSGTPSARSAPASASPSQR